MAPALGRVPSQLLARWRYDESYCRELTRRDDAADRPAKPAPITQ